MELSFATNRREAILEKMIIKASKKAMQKGVEDWTKWDQFIILFVAAILRINLKDYALRLIGFQTWCEAMRSVLE